uniref:Uncharacterized protein n=1 Tax=Cannabis sativa TaxID=3483 RepID=A0A803PDQ5_CANSA
MASTENTSGVHFDRTIMATAALPSTNWNPFSNSLSASLTVKLDRTNFLAWKCESIPTDHRTLRLDDILFLGVPPPRHLILRNWRTKCWHQQWKKRDQAASFLAQTPPWPEGFGLLSASWATNQLHKFLLCVESLGTKIHKSVSSAASLTQRIIFSHQERPFVNL